MTKNCTLKSRVPVFAVYTAGFVTATSKEFSASFWSFSYVRPGYDPSTTRLLFQPHSLDDGRCRGRVIIWAKQWLVRWAADVMCCMRANCVAGRPFAFRDEQLFTFLLTHASLLWWDRTAGPQIDQVYAYTRQRHVHLAWHPKWRMPVWRLYGWLKYLIQSSYTCLQIRRLCHNQWRLKASVKSYDGQDQDQGLSQFCEQQWTWSSSHVQRQSTVQRRWDDWLMLWPGLPRLYQVCVLRLCCTVVV